MAKIKGVNVIAPVVPFDTADVHPSHEARYGRGGYRTVATLVERDAIPAPRREAGMLVFVAADGKAYQLGSDLTTWAEFTSGVSSWNDLEDRPTDFPPSAHSHSISDVEDLSDALGEKVPKAGGTMDADATLTFPTAASSSEVGGWGFGVGLNLEGSAPGQYATVEPQAITVVNGSGSTQLTPAGLTLQNATQLVVGSFDNSTGGANGISLICAVGYELNWQGGRLRNVQIGGNGTPQPIFCDSTIEFTGEDGSVTVAATGITFPDSTVQATAWPGSLSYTALTDLPTLGTAAAEDTTAFAAASHGHVVADITDFPALGTAAASAVEDFAAASHGHSGLSRAYPGGYGDTFSLEANSVALLTSTQGQPVIQITDTSSVVSIGLTANGLPGITYSGSNSLVVSGATNSEIVVTDNSDSVTYAATGITFSDDTVQTTAWPGSLSYTALTDLPTLAAIATSGSASDLTTGTLANARLTTRQRASTNLYLWSSFR